MPGSQRPSAGFERCKLDDLEIEDEASFRHVALYADLKAVLRSEAYSFRVLPPAAAGRADRALLLNLTFWGADAGGDVLCDRVLEADVVTHVAWHHLAARALAVPGHAMSADALFVGEAIASAFDVYLVGRLLGHAPDSTFLESQVPRMAETAEAAGLSAAGFEALLGRMAADPDRAFGDLYALLVYATRRLPGAADAERALGALHAVASHPFSPLLHRYELSNWVLYARAYGDPTPDRRARAVDLALRTAPVPLDYLGQHWLAIDPGFGVSGSTAVPRSADPGRTTK